LAGKQDFFIPKEVLAHFRSAVKDGVKREKEWEASVKEYSKAFPELGKTLKETRSGQLPPDWENALPKFDDVEAKATRAYSGDVINAIADKIPQLIGGSGDLTPSNNTYIKSSSNFRGGQIRESEYPFRDPRTCDGLDDERHGPLRSA
jgi:transketolase